MDKHKNNESYERDKANWLYHLELHVKNEWSLATCDIVDVIDLLKESEWIGAKSQMLAEIYCLADDIAQDLDYNNSNDIGRELSKAIGEAILKGYQIMELIDDD